MKFKSMTPFMSTLALAGMMSSLGANAAGWQALHNPDGTPFTTEQTEQFTSAIIGTETSTGTLVTAVHTNAHGQVWIDTQTWATEYVPPRTTEVTYNGRSFTTRDGIRPIPLDANPLDHNWRYFLASTESDRYWAVIPLSDIDTNVNGDQHWVINTILGYRPAQAQAYDYDSARGAKSINVACTTKKASANNGRVFSFESDWTRHRSAAQYYADCPGIIYQLTNPETDVKEIYYRAAPNAQYDDHIGDRYQY